MTFYPPVDHAARLEDLLWLVDTGENSDGAARRMGLTYKALEKWSYLHAPEAWGTLCRRRARDHNGHTGKWTAA